MTELFRYIEQAFALPSAPNAIDTKSDSPFQAGIRNAVSQHQPPEQIRSLSTKFLDQNFPPSDENPIVLADRLLLFAKKLRALPSPSKAIVAKLVETVFDADAGTLVASDVFIQDNALLNDALVSVKLVTGFDRVNAADLATMRRATEFLIDFAPGNNDRTSTANPVIINIGDAFRRPLLIPKLFLDALKIKRIVPSVGRLSHGANRLSQHAVKDCVHIRQLAAVIEGPRELLWREAVSDL